MSENWLSVLNAIPKDHLAPSQQDFLRGHAIVEILREAVQSGKAPTCYQDPAAKRYALLWIELQYWVPLTDMLLILSESEQLQIFAFVARINTCFVDMPESAKRLHDARGLVDAVIPWLLLASIIVIKDITIGEDLQEELQDELIDGLLVDTHLFEKLEMKFKGASIQEGNIILKAYGSQLTTDDCILMGNMLSSKLVDEGSRIRDHKRWPKAAWSVEDIITCAKIKNKCPGWFLLHQFYDAAQINEQMVSLMGYLDRPLLTGRDFLAFFVDWLDQACEDNDYLKIAFLSSLVVKWTSIGLTGDWKFSQVEMFAEVMTETLARCKKWLPVEYFKCFEAYEVQATELIEEVKKKHPNDLYDAMLGEEIPVDVVTEIVQRALRKISIAFRKVTCSVCGSPGPGRLKICSRCKSVHYCSRDCQKKDWKQHKGYCKFLAGG